MAQCTLVKSDAVHSGKMQCILVKSDEFETMGIFHLQKFLENFHWEFPFGKSAFHLSQVPFEGAEEGLAT